jgi:translation initiation factor 5B
VKAKEAKDKAERVEVVHPAMLRFLPGCSFRVSHPAVIGVRVLAGRLTPGLKLLKDDGRTVGPIKSIQSGGKTVTEAHQGEEVAIAVEGATIGRQLKEEDILYLDLPGRDAKILFQMQKLSADERDVLEKVARIKRRSESFWGM